MSETGSRGVEASTPSLDVRELTAELARIRDQMRAEDQASGYQPSPGHARRRAELLRHERAIVRALSGLQQERPGQQSTDESAD